jgi:tripartite-type tricarboxylate transporter receptor subunit TctC
MRLARSLGIAAGAMLALAVPVLAQQDYPTKPVRIVVPFPPGAANDTLARIIAPDLGVVLGKQILVDNRAGAGGQIATEHVAGSAPDGYTLLLTSTALTTSPYLYKLKYDPVKAFDPVSMLAIADPAILAINPSLPAKTVQEFVALAKAKPGELYFAHSGIGTFLHTSGLLFAKSAGINVVDVPFKGAGPAIQNILGGDAHFIVVGYSSLGPFLSSGRLRPLGVASDKRSRYLPDVPTMAEQGLPEVKAANWFGLIAPAGTPPAIVQRLHKEIATIQDSPSYKSGVERLGAEAWKLTPGEFRDWIGAEIKKWGPVLAGIKPQ